jgi:hypothetical protein
MTTVWQIVMDRRLMDGDIEIWTTGMLWNEASSMTNPPSKPTFERWLARANASGRLRKIRGGLYLNASGNRLVSPAAAAGFIRRFAVPSLSWVLEQDWILNNMGDVITCVLPFGPGLPVPNLSRVKTDYGEFRFNALPGALFEPVALDVPDWRDARFAHPRATPEKAFCDWLYLAASHRSAVSTPPLDLELARLQSDRLDRVAKAMKIEPLLATWLAAKERYDQDPETAENESSRMKPTTDAL